MELARPDKNMYWVIPGRLLAGEYPGHIDEQVAREKLRHFLEAGLTWYIDLTEKRDRLRPYATLLHEEAARRGLDVVYRRMPIRDARVPPSKAAMAAILDAIDEGLAGGHRVYVHCWGGIGRTGTVVGCYLVRQGQSGAQALATLAGWWQTVAKAARRPHSPETQEQKRWVQQWTEPQDR